MTTQKIFQVEVVEENYAYILLLKIIDEEQFKLFIRYYFYFTYTKEF